MSIYSTDVNYLVGAGFPPAPQNFFPIRTSRQKTDQINSFDIFRASRYALHWDVSCTSPLNSNLLRSFVQKSVIRLTPWIFGPAQRLPNWDEVSHQPTTQQFPRWLRSKVVTQNEHLPIRPVLNRMAETVPTRSEIWTSRISVRKLLTKSQCVILLYFQKYA